uniref:Uncharacterized protein n=1 Tax=Grammatophora oceanica TaxID=210454 RepID=A0A7S1Y476_9STRA|mmetsp:Transcript_23941/g.35376  ORF Transcript_23941/g.35376 Transcript_23941/m.35376 type:complete len:254 (+) Transcript_23941:168-929(+)
MIWRLIIVRVLMRRTMMTKRRRRTKRRRMKNVGHSIELDRCCYADEECLFVLKKQVKEQIVEEKKVTWGRHVEVLQHRGEFGRTYHMELETFEKLVEILRPSVTLDAMKSSSSTQGESIPIYPELVVAVGLRWLGGGKYCDVDCHILCSSCVSSLVCRSFAHLPTVRADVQPCSLQRLPSRIKFESRMLMQTWIPTTKMRRARRTLASQPVRWCDIGMSDAFMRETTKRSFSSGELRSTGSCNETHVLSHGKE